MEKYSDFNSSSASQWGRGRQGRKKKLMARESSLQHVPRQTSHLPIRRLIGISSDTQLSWRPLDQRGENGNGSILWDLCKHEPGCVFCAFAIGGGRQVVASCCWLSPLISTSLEARLRLRANGKQKVAKSALVRQLHGN